MRKLSPYSILLSLFTILTLNSCNFDLFDENDFAIPRVTLQQVTNNSLNETEVTFTVIETSDFELEYMGIGFNLSGNPSVADNQQLFEGEEGTFVVTLTDLIVDSTYFFKAFAANSLSYSESSAFEYRIPEPVAITAPCSPVNNMIVEDGSSYQIRGNFSSKSTAGSNGYGTAIDYVGIGGRRDLYFSFNQIPLSGIYTTTSLDQLSRNNKSIYVRFVNGSSIQSGSQIYVENINGESLKYTFCDLSFIEFSREVILVGSFNTKIN